MKKMIFSVLGALVLGYLCLNLFVTPENKEKRIDNVERVFMVNSESYRLVIGDSTNTLKVIEFGDIGDDVVLICDVPAGKSMWAKYADDDNDFDFDYAEIHLHSVKDIQDGEGVYYSGKNPIRFKNTLIE